MSVEGESVGNPLVQAAITAWFEAIKSGVPPDREEFIDRYPDIKTKLRRFFANYDVIQDQPDPDDDEQRDSSESQPSMVTILEKHQTPSHATRAESTGTKVAIDSVTTGARYRGLKKYKEGGLGILYRGHDESLHRETAVKFIKDAPASDPELLKQFRVEAEITGRLDHPGVVPVYGIGEDWTGKPFYVMRFIKGVELTEAVREYHTARIAHPNHAETRQLLMNLLEHLISASKTVAYAHDVGILHCDLKPANIMVGKYGETFVLDWGLAGTFDRIQRANEPTMLRPRSAGESSSGGQRGGTYGYISPEQLSFDQQIAPTSDVYSLGATLYEILTNKPPFNGRDKDVNDKILKGQFSPPRTEVKTVPKRLEAICLKAMSLAPERRYSSATHLANDLTNWMRDEAIVAAPDQWYHRLGRVVRRHLAITVTLALATLAITAEVTRSAYQAEKSRYLNQKNELVKRSLDTSLDTFEGLCRPLANGEMNNLGVFRPFADKINEFATNYLREFDSNPMMLPHTGRVYELRATVSRVLSSDSQEALGYYKQAEDNYRAENEATTDEKRKDELSQRLSHLELNQGLLFIQNEKYVEAEKILSKTLAVSERLHKKRPDNADLGRDLAEVYHLLGQAYLNLKGSSDKFQNGFDLAEELFLKSADLRKALLKDAKGSERSIHKRDLARSFGYLGDLYLLQGHLAQAELNYKESKNLRHELHNKNRMDPEYRFQYARGLGNFAFLDRCYKGHLDLAVERLKTTEELQNNLSKEFELATFHSDLAFTRNSLAEVYLWQAIEHADDRDKSAELFRKSKEAAESAQSQRPTDPQSEHSFAWSLATIATVEQLENDPGSARHLEEAMKLLSKRAGGETALGRDELVTLAIVRSLQGEIQKSFRTLKLAIDRGENTGVRFEKLGTAGLKALARDPTYGPQYHELCKQVAGTLIHGD